MMRHSFFRTIPLALALVCVSLPAANSLAQEAPRIEIAAPAEADIETDIEAEETEIEVMEAEEEPAEMFVDGDIEEMGDVEQLTMQLRPMLQVELDFIRQTCDLSEQQRPRIKAAGEASLKEAADAYFKQQQGGIRLFGGLGRQAETPHPRKTIRTGLTAALQETLSPDQAARYQDELKKRIANHQRAAILSAVSRLDEALCLTADQRQNIADAITAGWQEKWESWLMLFQYGDEYYPTVPNRCIVKFLEPDQQVTWRSLQKIEVGIWDVHVEAIDAIEGDDEWWGVALPVEKPAKKPEQQNKGGLPGLLLDIFFDR